MNELESRIRNLWCNTGELPKDEVIDILLSLFYEIQKLQAAMKEQP